MRRSRRKARLYFYIPFWLLMLGMFVGLIAIQMGRYEDYRRELNRLNAELVQERRITADLHYQRAFYESDAYIERLARERLGFVRHDEIIFLNIAE
ncbi:MAG: septum formation initiator family protein [Defluviitaleaceae bacterium]|nr:septum formation initiator family protein [Defluviitaleaceae bacterium]